MFKLGLIIHSSITDMVFILRTYPSVVDIENKEVVSGNLER